MDPKDFVKHVEEDFSRELGMWSATDLNKGQEDKLKTFEKLSIEEKLLLLYLKVIGVEKELQGSDW